MGEDTNISGSDVRAAMARAGERLVAMRDELNRLDAAMGDGDCGITMAKGGAALLEVLRETAGEADLGKLLSAVAMTFNRVAPSTLGTVIATGLLRAAQQARGQGSIDAALLAKMLHAACAGICERGEVAVGDKTIVDALSPAVSAFALEAEKQETLAQAAAAMLNAAREGRDRAIPLLSKKGRGIWTGERSRNQADPGTVMFVGVLEAVLRIEPEQRPEQEPSAN